MEDIVVTIWRLIKEKSSVRRISMELGMDRASLYRSLKKGTNPRIDTIIKFLNHLGYRLQVVKAKRGSKKPAGLRRAGSRRRTKRQ
jgi:DNA-binding phage protein